MAKIPTYNSQVNLTTDVGASKVSGFTQTAGVAGEAMQKLGAVAADLGAKMQKVRVEEESERAMLEATKRLNKIQWDASVDTTVDGFNEKYAVEIAKARNDIAESIKDGQARRLFTDKFNFDAVNTEMKVKQYGYKNLVESRLMTINERTNSLTSAYYAETDPVRKQQYLTDISHLYQVAANEGTISKLDAQKNIDKLNAGLPKGQAEWDIIKNPEYALAELERGDMGAYAGLDMESRTDLIQRAESRIEKQKKENERNIVIAQNKFEDDLLKQRIAGTLTEDAVRKAQDSGQIRPEFAISQIKNLRSNKSIGAKTKAESFNSVVDAMFNEENKPEDIRKAILQENAKGNINDDDMAMLVDFNDHVSKKTIENSIQAQYPKNIWQQMTFWTDEYASKREDIRTALFKDYFTRVKQGTDPSVALQQAQAKQLINLRPDLFVGIGPDGTQVIDKSGVVATVLPDGRIKK